LTRDEKRPNGLPLGPWYKGLNLLWEAIVVDSFSLCHYKNSNNYTGTTATDPDIAKWQKYDDLLNNYYFHPVAMEITGVYGQSFSPILSGLAKKLVDMSGDPKEQQWLHQHLYLPVARGNRGNVASILPSMQV